MHPGEQEKIEDDGEEKGKSFAQIRKIVYLCSPVKRKVGRVVDGGGLENR